jgi:hypothetical protein
MLLRLKCGPVEITLVDVKGYSTEPVRLDIIKGIGPRWSELLSPRGRDGLGREINLSKIDIIVPELLSIPDWINLNRDWLMRDATTAAIDLEEKDYPTGPVSKEGIENLRSIWEETVEESYISPIQESYQLKYTDDIDGGYRGLKVKVRYLNETEQTTLLCGELCVMNQAFSTVERKVTRKLRNKI